VTNYAQPETTNLGQIREMDGIDHVEHTSSVSSPSV
jgi:hypothetical protein